MGYFPALSGGNHDLEVKKPICLVALCLSIGAVSCGGEEETTEEPVCDTDHERGACATYRLDNPSEPTTSEALVAKLVEGIGGPR